MSPTAQDPTGAAGALAPDLANRLTAFARACRAAARAVALYPSDHPALAATLEVVTAAAQAATGSVRVPGRGGNSVSR